MSNFFSQKSDQIEESKNPYAIDTKFVVERSEEPKKNFFIKGFFGEIEKSPKSNDELNKSFESGGENEGDSSPNKNEPLTEEERMDKFHDLNMKQKVMYAKMQTILERIEALEKSNLSEHSPLRIKNLLKELDNLQKKSNEITAIKEHLENQDPLMIKLRKEQGFTIPESPENKKPFDCKVKIKESERKLLMHKLELKILELYRKISNHRIEELEKEVEIDNCDKLDCDSYLFTSMLMEYFIFFIGYGVVILLTVTFFMIHHIIVLLLHPFAILLGLSTLENFKEAFHKAKEKFIQIISVCLQIVFILLFFQVLLSPAILVVVTQLYCVYNLGNVTYSAGDANDTFPLLVMKELMVVFFFFLSMKEISSSIEAISYHYKRTFIQPHVWSILFPIRMAPQVVQIVMTFWFCYINMYLIGQVDDSPDLIQNFSSLAIALEFDNYVMDFLRYIRFYFLYNKFLETFVGDASNKKKKISKVEKKMKIEEYERGMKEYENILESIKNERRKSKLSLHPILETEKPELFVQDAKEKIEHIKKQNPQFQILANEENEESSDQRKDVSEFWTILNSIVNQNIVKTAITFLGKQGAIKEILTNSDYPIDRELKLSKGEKTVFNWVAFLVIMMGSLIILLIFFIAEKYQNLNFF